MPPTSARQVFDALPGRFSKEAAGDLSAVFQFEIADTGTWVVTIDDGTCAVTETPHPDPTVTLMMTEPCWIELATGELSAVAAFMSGRLKTRGNIMLAQRLGKLFGLKM